MRRVAAASQEYLVVRVRGDEETVLDTQAISFALVEVEDHPTLLDWTPGSWLGVAGRIRRARWMYEGNKEAGNYALWALIEESPETIQRYVANVTLY